MSVNRDRAIERANRFFGKRPWWLENMVDAILEAAAQEDPEVEEHPCGDWPAPCNCIDPDTHDRSLE